jgi:hypothetical protein
MAEVPFLQEHKNGPFILNIVTPAHPCAHDIPFILNIVTPAHPCAHDIPFILNIKKARC